MCWTKLSPVAFRAHLEHIPHNGASQITLIADSEKPREHTVNRADSCSRPVQVVQRSEGFWILWPWMNETSFCSNIYGKNDDTTLTGFGRIHSGHSYICQLDLFLQKRIMRSITGGLLAPTRLVACMSKPRQITGRRWKSKLHSANCC